MKRWPVVLMFLLLLMPLFSVPAGGDGCPVIPSIDGYLTLRENRQLACIYVGEETESLNLFLSVVSLDPGQPLTIVIPLKTHPSGLMISNTTESDFSLEHHFATIERESVWQHEGAGAVGKEISTIAPPLSGMEAFGFPALCFYYINGRMASSGNAVAEYYGQPGLSVEVYSFNSSDSLGEFYESLNVSVPQNVGDILTKYQDYSVAVINTMTKPPIKESDFNNLTRAEPEVMADFKEYVSAHPKITVYEHSYFEDKELNEIIWRISDYELRSTFYDLILATYGIAPANGFQLSVDLPLANGNECYFPLGTSPSWNSITKTTVIFALSSDKEASFNVPGTQIFMDEWHYYRWDFEDDAPDYDISGIQKEKGPGTSWAEFSAGTNRWAYKNSSALAIFIILLSFTLIWASLLLAYFRKRGGRFSALNILRFFGWGIFLVFFSFIFSVFLAIPVALKLMGEEMGKLDSPAAEEEYRPSLLVSTVGWGWYIIIAGLALSPVLLVLSFAFVVLSPVSVPSSVIFFFFGLMYLFMLSLTAFHAYVRYRLRTGGPVVKEEPPSLEVSFLKFQSFLGLALAVVGSLLFTAILLPIFYADFEGSMCLFLQASYISLGISLSLAILIYRKRGLFLAT